MTSACPVCLTEAKCRNRDFSEQAWKALVLWKELEKKASGKSICDECYLELREILIERSDEIQGAPSVRTPAERPKPRRTGSKAAG